jgi:hypothetical protein
VPRPIRKTSFTWDVDYESRSAVWGRIKTHVQQELDRIHAEHIRDRRIARRRARPGYARNQQLIAAAQRGSRWETWLVSTESAGSGCGRSCATTPAGWNGTDGIGSAANTGIRRSAGPPATGTWPPRFPGRG